MFKAHARHVQKNLLSSVSQLPKTMKDYLENSWAGLFYKRVFCKIDEKKYEPLFSAKKSRPNFPINVLVGLEIMKWLFNWSDEDMVGHFHFNLQTCYALGLESLGELSLSERTIYYHRARVLAYEERTGVNLHEETFRLITQSELKALGVDASVQRMDSTFISSNIKKMSRLEICLKVLQNFYKELPKQAQERSYDKIKGYVEIEPDNYVFKIKPDQVEKKLKVVGELLAYFQALYANDNEINRFKSYKHIKRVLKEQFTVSDEVENLLTVKPAEEVKSDSLQNPADDETTFRRKRNENHTGYLLNVSETCAKENKVQLIADVSVQANNVSDDKILQARIGNLKDRTDLDELIVDGGYSGERSENACKEQEVELIFTGIKGPAADSEKITLSQFELDETGVKSCPKGSRPISQKFNEKSKRHIVYFDKERCKKCPLRNQCCVEIKKKWATLYYNDRQISVARKRQKFKDELYRSKQKLRPAVEGTISLFKRRTRKGKVCVRGLKKVRNAMILMAIGVNFRRVAAAIDDFFIFSLEFCQSALKIIRFTFLFDVKSALP